MEMNHKVPVKYGVYNLMTYFAKQPQSFLCCPDCSGALSTQEISPSKAAQVAVRDGQTLMAFHAFTRLYRCNRCLWWGVWESLDFFEYGGAADYFLARVNEGKIECMVAVDQYTTPWTQILEDESIYKYAIPLPHSLGQLFLFGERKHSY